MFTVILKSVLVSILWVQWAAGSDGMSGFPAESAVTARAAQLHSLVAHPNELRVYPDLTFDCSGSVGTVRLLVNYSGTSDNAIDLSGLQLRLWRPEPQPANQGDSDEEEGNGGAGGGSSLPDTAADINCLQYRQLLSNMFRQPALQPEFSSRRGALRLLQFQLETPMAVTAGDIISLRQRSGGESQLALLYQEGGGPQWYTAPDDGRADGRMCLRPVNSEGNKDYPLIAVDFVSTEGQQDSDCVRGFLTSGDLNRIINSGYINSKVQGMEPSEQRLLIPPPRSFTCGGKVTKWTVALQGVHDGEAGHYPELQVWRRKGSQSVYKQATTTLSTDSLVPTAHANVYDIHTDSVTFERGDLFGLYQPPSSSDVPILHYFKTDRRNFLMYSEDTVDTIESNVDEIPMCSVPPSEIFCANPLVSVQTECNTDCQGNCTRGFMDQNRLISLAALLGSVEYSSGEASVIPGLSFTSDGRVLSWVFAARSEGLGSGRTQLPHIQIWRPVSSWKREIPAEYQLADSTEKHNVALEVTNRYNVYRYRLKPPMRVQAGDVIGIQQPSTELSRLSLAFLDDVGPTNYLLAEDAGVLGDDSDRTQSRRLPLVTGEFQPMVPGSDTTSTVQPTPTIPSCPATTSCNQGSTGGGGGGGGSVGAIAGAVLGVLVAALAVLAVVVVGCIVLRRRKKRKMAEQRRTLAQDSVLRNPSYEMPRESSTLVLQGMVPLGRSQRDSQLYQTVGEPQMYGVPLMYEVPQTYEVPTISVAREQQMDQHTYEETGQSSGDSIKDDVTYHTLEPSRPNSAVEGGEDHVNHVPEGLKTSSLTKPPPLPRPRTRSGGSHSDCDIVVPSPTQRQTLHLGRDSSTDKPASPIDLYASLRKSQFGSVTPSISPSSTASSQFFEESSVFWRPASRAESLYEQLSNKRYREIPRHQIQTTEHLGSGQFGTVNKGIWHSSRASRVVAIKMLQSSAKSEDTVRFLQEAAINGQFRHPNIVELFGVVTVDKPMMMILELLPNGDLSTFLNQHRPAPGELPGPEWPQMLLSFCQHVSAGMDYLSAKGFVHRDLAARNILVSKEKICKIGDFGMSRDLEEESYYFSKGGKIPLKWTAPEALHYKKYSTASDVWSFGCLMYEIWSLGHEPFEECSNSEVLQLVDNGSRLAPPPGCPREIYKLMVQCWHPTAALRPSFPQLLRELIGSHEGALLGWTKADRETHPQAQVLGAPLKAGRDLYVELQNAYLKG